MRNCMKLDATQYYSKGEKVENKREKENRQSKCAMDYEPLKL